MATTEQLQTALAGRYTIERKIGEGGMATVYLARDLKHDRKVALKVLKPELGAVLGVERFLSEIKVTANLQHPNLLPLFDSGEAGGLLFYVMPFVEGETLRTRLEREQQLPVEEAVRIGSAIASALAYAHERGVIHRDLKPENILIQSGQPVVADFGIALAVSNAGGARVTQTGLSLGTPQYMSPEQATGDRTIDARSDIYSLAAMTYEMMAGEPPHTGPNAQAIMAKLLTAEAAPLSSVRKSAPLHVEFAIAKGLAKVPADRFASAAEFAAALDGSRAVTRPATVVRTAAGAVRARLSWREGAGWGLALAGLGAAVWFATRTQPAAPMRRFTIDPPDSVVVNGSSIGGTSSVAVSPDGRTIAFVGSHRLRNKLYVRQLDESEARELPGTEGASRPVFSQDGRTLFFLDLGGSLNSVAVSGGSARKLADSVSANIAAGDDGSLYFSRQGWQLFVLRGEKGTPQLVAKLDSAAETRFGSLAVLPGSRRAIVALREGMRLGVLAEVDLRSGELRPTSIEAALVRHVEPGFFVMARGAGEIRVAPADANGLPNMDQAVSLAQDAVSPAVNAADFAVASQEGTLVYRRQRSAPLPATQVVLAGVGGASRVLRSDGRRYDQPVVSPDGSRAVLRVGATAFNNGDLWLLDLASGAFTPLTRGNASYRPSWSRDGKRILYVTGNPGESVVHSLPWDGSGADSVVVQKPSIAEFAEGPRGGWSVIRNYAQRDLFIVPAESAASATWRPLIVAPSNETSPQLSPNGRLVAYQSDQSGEVEVYITAVPGPGPRVPVSVGGGRSPRWSPDGSRLFYRGGTDLHVATIVERPEPAVSKREVVPGVRLAEDAEVNFARLPDGKLLTTLGPPAPPRTSQLSVITNWQSLFTKRAAPVARP